MHVQVNNMLGIHDAQIPLTPGKITLISGPNASGKTSIATAIGAVLAHDDNPLHAASAQRKAYLRDDTESGEVVLLDHAGNAVVRWQLTTSEMARMTEAGEAASPAAVGLVDFINGVTTPKARVELWEGYFLPPPDTLLEQLRKQLKARLDAKVIDGVMDTIAKSGWEVVGGIYKERAREAKANWMKLTGQKWGKRIGAKWTPDDWLSEYDGVKVDKADEDLADAQAALQATHVENAISAADAERAAEAEAEVEAAKTKVADAEAAFGDAGNAHQAGKERLDRLMAEGQGLRKALNEVLEEEPKAGAQYSCPSCNNPLMLRDGALVAFDEQAWKADRALWEGERDEAQKDVDEKTAEYNAAEADLAPFAEAMTKASAALRTAEAELSALQRTVSAGKGEVESEEAQDAVREAEAEVERKRTRRDKIARKIDAFNQHESVVEYELIASILGPSGVRGTAMKEAMDLLDQVLDPIAQIASWPRVRIDTGYAISIDGRTLLRVCAKSEQLRAQYSLQIGVARCRRDPVIVLDEADILDRDERVRLRGLLETMLSRPEPPAVVICGTDFDPAEWPDAHRYVLDGQGRAIEA